MSILAQLLPKKEQKELFLTICLSDHVIRAAIAQIVDQTITVIGHGEAHISEHESPVSAADAAVTHAEQHLTHHSQVTSAVFALPQYYLEGDAVQPDHIEMIKTICTELDLSPRGYIEYPGAISYYLEKEEGSPPTLLLVALEADQYTFTLLRLGQVQQQTHHKASGSFTGDFSTALSHLSAEILPSRILMYDNGKSLEHQREELLKFPWHKHAQFIHTPKVEIFPQSHLMAALIEAGASSFLRSLPAHHTPTDTTSEQEKEEEDNQREEKEHIQHEHQSGPEPIAIISDDIQKFAHKVLENAQQTLGFTDTDSDTHHRHIPQQEDSQKITHTSHQAKEKLKNIIPSSFSIKRFLPRISLSTIPLFIPVIILLAGIAGLVWHIPKATVSLGVYPLTLSQDTQITFVSSADQASDSSTLVVSEPNAQVTGEKSMATTGIGKIGEKANGSVTVYNKTSTSKTFAKGSILTNGNLRFTLSDDVSVASASDTGEGLSFGKASVPVSAASIGPESNLAANSVFAFKDFPDSSYTAKNTDALKGGISRDVTSVSKEDQKTLETQLTQELIASGTQQLRQSLGSGEQLLDNSIKTEVVTKKFSADVGSEAKEVSLSMSLMVKGKSYQQDQIKSLAQKAFASIPSGYDSTPRTVSTSMKQVKQDKDGTTHATIQIAATFLPTIDLTMIKSHLIGRSYSQAETYLKSIPQIGSVQIYAARSLPLYRHRLPLSASSITLQTIVH